MNSYDHLSIGTPASIALTPTTANPIYTHAHTDDQELQMRKLAGGYSIPPALKLALDADAKQANAVAIITALFAAGLLTLAQLIATKDDNTSPAWEALRFFSYSAIILNLTGTFLCLMIIKMCTDLPHRAQQMVLLQPHSWPSRAARGETLSTHLLTHRWALLSSFGMSRRYPSIDSMFVFVVLLGCIFTFVSVTLWVWLTESFAVSGATMITIVPGFVVVIYATGVAGYNEYN